MMRRHVESQFQAESRNENEGRFRSNSLFCLCETEKNKLVCRRSAARTQNKMIRPLRKTFPALMTRHLQQLQQSLMGAQPVGGARPAGKHESLFQTAALTKSSPEEILNHI